MEVPYSTVKVDEDIVYSPNKYRDNRGYKGDRIKGVVARPVPKEWLNSRMFKINNIDTDDIIYEKTINANIAAEIKPWFFIYRYSHLKSDLDKYERAVRSNCKIRFGKTLDDLYAAEDKTEEECEFIYNYEKYMPVSRAPGTINRICWAIEDEFKTLDMLPDVEFDSSILKSDVKYTDDDFNAIKKLYDDYNNSMQLFLKGYKKNDISKEEREAFSVQIVKVFSDECYKACPNTEMLTNILVDVCYTTNKNKSFAWDIVGEQIFNNVLKNSGYQIEYPVQNECGNIEFCGNRFSLHTQQIGGDINADSE